MDAFRKYDFVELIVFDVHSVARGRLVSQHRLETVLERGMGMYGGICYFGIRGEVMDHEYFSGRKNFANLQFFPIPETLTDSLPCVRGKHNVGQVLCLLKNRDGLIEKTTPRVVAEKQLEELKALDCSIRSSFEIEFTLCNAESFKPFGHELRWANMKVIQSHEEVFLDFFDELKSVGIDVDTIQTEGGVGQYEVTMNITEGLKMADMAARFRNAASIYFGKKNLISSFMTRDQMRGISNGLHFNHSLWTSDGLSLFLDLKDPDNLSALGRHWLAGLITHCKALTALCCPTVNCYRRLFKPWAPSAPNWNKDCRNSCFRLKVEGKDNVYIENRLPSSASNPYFVMAGVVAAGMDGIKRKLPLEKVDCEQELPRSLERALTALEEDQYMVESLGKEFVKMFTYTKRTFEIEPMKQFSGLSNEETLEEERKMYLHFF